MKFKEKYEVYETMGGNLPPIGNYYRKHFL
jgi:hypothetical protein